MTPYTHFAVSVCAWLTNFLLQSVCEDGHIYTLGYPAEEKEKKKKREEKRRGKKGEEEKKKSVIPNTSKPVHYTYLRRH